VARRCRRTSRVDARSLAIFVRIFRSAGVIVSYARRDISLNTTNAERYHARFRKVLEYIDAHLGDELTVDTLSSIAAFSKYHFHRQFSELFGIRVYKYVRLRRLKRASGQLAFRSDSSIIDIACANGYEGPESFPRAFRKNIGQSPSEFRKQPQWDSWHVIYQPLNELRSHHMKPATRIDQVGIVDFPATRVAVFEHRGDPRLIGDTVRSFIAWRKQNRLHPRVSATFNILYDNPAEVAPEDYRLDLCAATDRDVTGNMSGIVCKTIPGGRCAVLRHVGSNDMLGETIKFLYAEWLPQSGEVVRDFPIYLQRVKFFPDVPENEAITDVFLPLGEVPQNMSSALENSA
jgi:AraC family transcriptional regulator